MNWYKKAQASFATLKVDDQLIHLFKTKFEEYISRNKNAQQILNKKQSIHLGNINLPDLIQPILNKYGKPELVPHILQLEIINSKNKNIANPSSQAIFYKKPNGNLCIAIIEDNLNNVHPEEWNELISHEFQHLLKSLYEGKATLQPYSQKPPDFNNPWEIQSYANEIAKNSFQTIKEILEFRTQNMPQNRKQEIINNLNKNRNDLISKYLQNDLLNFLKKIEISEESKRKYYTATIKNFNRMMDNLGS